jgi:predicted amidohydrolase YtcJ
MRPTQVILTRISIAACLGLLGAISADAAEPPKHLFINGHVWTADPSRPEAEAFAIAGDRIVDVGSTAEVTARAGSGAELTDLEGRRVVPGFNDAHWHLPARWSVRLDAAGSVEVIQQRLFEHAKEVSADGWIHGRGWMPPDFPANAPHRRYIDAVLPDRLVLLRDRDGHQALVNSKVLALAGITRDTPDPDGGRILRDAAGEPTGVLQESAVDLVNRLVWPMSVDHTYQLLLEEMDAAARHGLTSLQDASEGLTEVQQGAVDRAVAQGRMLVRYRAAFPLLKSPSPGELNAWVARRDSSLDRLVSYGIAKGFVDGTVDAKTAVMLEPYVGGGNGLQLWSQADLDGTVAAYDAAGLQVQLHAIGDGGIRTALDAFERAAQVNGRRDSRHRVEHIEVPALADLPRFRKLGVIASTQAIFARPDDNTFENYVPLLGPERSARAIPFRLFDEAGAVQAFGSDYPVFPMDVLLGIYTAVTRQTAAGTPPGGWHPEHRITVEAALRHYTIDAAYASFDESRKGSLTPGKYADFVVLSRDILGIPPRELLETKVLLTVMGGRVTHRAGEIWWKPKP